jgi:hypothetical protein
VDDMSTTYREAIAEYQKIKDDIHYPFWQGVRFKGGRLDLQKIFKTARNEWYHDAKQMNCVKVTPNYKAIQSKNIASVSVEKDGRVILSSYKSGKIGIKKISVITCQQKVAKKTATSWTGHSK